MNKGVSAINNTDELIKILRTGFTLKRVVLI